MKIRRVKKRFNTASSEVSLSKTYNSPYWLLGFCPTLGYVIKEAIGMLDFYNSYMSALQPWADLLTPIFLHHGQVNAWPELDVKCAQSVAWQRWRDFLCHILLAFHISSSAPVPKENKWQNPVRKIQSKSQVIVLTKFFCSSVLSGWDRNGEIAQTGATHLLNITSSQWTWPDSIIFPLPHILLMMWKLQSSMCKTFQVLNVIKSSPYSSCQHL